MEIVVDILRIPAATSRVQVIRPRSIISTMLTTDSDKPIADSRPCRSHWRNGGPLGADPLSGRFAQALPSSVDRVVIGLP